MEGQHGRPAGEKREVKWEFRMAGWWIICLDACADKVAVEIHWRVREEVDVFLGKQLAALESWIELELPCVFCLGWGQMRLRAHGAEEQSPPRVLVVCSSGDFYLHRLLGLWFCRRSPIQAEQRRQLFLLYSKVLRDSTGAPPWVQAVQWMVFCEGGIGL